jgi:hypothetical protein
VSGDLSRFPLDFDKLQRGGFLTPEQVEAATLKQRTDPQFWAASLQLRSLILAHFRGRGDLVTVISEGDGLRILTHSEQAEYAPMREERAVRQLVLSHAEGKAVDVAQLSDEQRQRHERWMLRNAFRVQQALKKPPPELMP